MTTRSVFRSLLWATLVFLAAPAAHASYTNCTSGQLPWASAIANNMQNSLPAGGRVNGSTAGTTINIDCASTWTASEGTNCQGTVNWALAARSGSISTTAFPNVFRLAGMPSGVGFQFVDGAGNAMPLDRNSRVDTGVAIRTGTQTIPLRARIIKIDNTATAGTFVLSFVMTCSSNEYANLSSAQSQIDLTVTTKLLTQTCAMTTSDVQVTLPKVTVQSFSGIGTAAGTTMVPLSFQCDPNVDARINFSDAQTPTNNTNVLTLQPESSAAGLGVQMISGGSPVTLSPNDDFNIGGTDIPLQNPSGAATGVMIPLLAQYVQTAATIIPGHLRARALVNIAYN